MLRRDSDLLTIREESGELTFAGKLSSVIAVNKAEDGRGVLLLSNGQHRYCDTPVTDAAWIVFGVSRRKKQRT